MGRKDANHIEIAEALLDLVVTVVAVPIVLVIDKSIRSAQAKLATLKRKVYLHIMTLCANTRSERK